MKKKEWNEGLNHLDSDLVDAYVETKDRIRKKKAAKAVWLRLGAVAACLALIVGAFLVVLMLIDDGNLVVPTPSTTSARTDSTNAPATTQDRIRPNIPLVTLQNPSSAPQYYGMEFSDDSSPSAEINTEGISVTAKLLEVLPDTYTFYDDWDQTKFRLLKMETVKLLKGGAMNECFYYIVAEPYMTDFTLYDRFVLIDMGQYGYEYSVLYNQTKGCAEQLDTALFGYLKPMVILMQDFGNAVKIGYLVPVGLIDAIRNTKADILCNKQRKKTAFQTVTVSRIFLQTRREKLPKRLRISSPWKMACIYRRATALRQQALQK